jgi:hypothetical protein
VVPASTGASSDDAAVTGTDDPFCVASRQWAAFELVEPDYTDPEALAAYWPEHLAHVAAVHAVAPAEIADAWDTYVAVTDGMTVVLERYEFDGARFEEEGTPEEHEALEPTDPELLAADAAVVDFEAERCGSQELRAADVSFAGEQPGAYCDAVGAQNEDFGEVAASGFDPAVVEAVVADFEADDEALLAAAPEAIREDVAALNAWEAERQMPVLEAYDFDFRRILLEASTEQLTDFNRTSPEIGDHVARTLAYEEQVCGS